MNIHFIAGLPRSGSTLLSSLLNQHPRFNAGVSSPVSMIVNSALTAMSPENEASSFITNEKRAKILRGIFKGYYVQGYDNEHDVFFDSHRSWPTKLPLIKELFPQAKLICCVRNVSDILNSVERLVQQNPNQPSAIFKFRNMGSTYGRAEYLMRHPELVGYSIAAMKQMLASGKHLDSVVLVRYKSLTDRPKMTLSAIYDFINEPYYEDHTTTDLKQLDGVEEFDKVLGTPGLHTLLPEVRSGSPPRLLPDDLYNLHNGRQFWESARVRII